MLEDFLEENRLDAELISFPERTTFQKALFETGMPFSSAIEIDFYFGKGNNGYLFIVPYKSKLDFGRLRQLTGVEKFVSPNEDETMDSIGYEKGLLPPVSIYGVKVFLDKSLQGKEYLFCRVSEKDFLKISPDSIVEANEGIVIESISRRD